MEYADHVKHCNPPVDGFIMQGPVSDREAMDEIFPSHQDTLDLADEWIAQGRAHDCLPRDKVPQDLGAPITAYRFRSLVAKKYVGFNFLCQGVFFFLFFFFGKYQPPICYYTDSAKHPSCSGDDDYFSSDLDDDTVRKYWRRFNKPVLALHSANEEHVPHFVNQITENQRFQKANPMVSPLSGLIPEASHQVLEENAREWLGQRVVEFLQTLEK